MALANGSMRRPLSGTTASGPDSPTPMTDAPSKTPPFAYQLTLTLGTEPVFGLNDPRMEKCGSGPTCILGSLSWSDETSAAMREHAADTAWAADCAPSSAVRANWSNAAEAAEVAAGSADTIAERAATAAEDATSPAAIAAEQQAAAAEAPAEVLPAVTLDELEQVDLGTVEQGERAPFRITDDRCADWAIRKIAEERSEYNRLKELADQQKAAIEEKVEAARRRMENGTAFLTSCLADFFNTVPHKTTKTTEKYRLLSGTLTLKKGTVKATVDDAKLVPWLRENGYGDLVKVEESAKWGELKKLLAYTGEIATIQSTGEIVEGVTAYETPATFTVDI